MLKANKPLGIREIQRALNLSSPSLVQYHLAKLEQAELVKKDQGNYVVNRVLLDNCVKISRFMVPRYMFYSVFMAVVLSLELTLLKPEIFSREYYFYVAATVIALIIFCYETVRVWAKGTL
jgi:DNA-binding transcriptional ArsR family regulator